MPIALLIFIGVPIAEIWVLLTVSGQIGILPTIGLVVLTAVIGVALLKQQSFSTIARANQRMRSGEMPAQEMAEGIFLAVGGALLLTPGFITDTIGFACLIPGIRQWLLGRVLSHWQVVQVRRFSEFQQGSPFNDAGRGPDGGNRNTIDGQSRRDD